MMAPPQPLRPCGTPPTRPTLTGQPGWLRSVFPFALSTFSRFRAKDRRTPCPWLLPRQEGTQLTHAEAPHGSLEAAGGIVMKRRALLQAGIPIAAGLPAAAFTAPQPPIRV